ncbi:MAG: translation initiation factor IF-3 [Epulopiscium sp.]|nr:translation initiation factor IF-3 [Candidatus Epulonipiscium sp.]
MSDLLINEQIRDKEVRLIDVDGKQLGIVSIQEAQAVANERNLDLVKIAPKANPPVCRVMDYGKYKFDMAKKEKEAKKKQKVINVKEVRLSPNIDKHDLETKIKSAIKFLKGGDKVKVTVRFKGREMAHLEKGKELLDNFAKAIEEYGQVEKQAKLEGKNNLVIIVTPLSM